jgi:hypothetical protein
MDNSKLLTMQRFFKASRGFAMQGRSPPARIGG